MEPASGVYPAGYEVVFSQSLRLNSIHRAEATTTHSEGTSSGAKHRELSRPVHSAVALFRATTHGHPQCRRGILRRETLLAIHSRPVVRVCHMRKCRITVSSLNSTSESWSLTAVGSSWNGASRRNLVFESCSTFPALIRVFRPVTRPNTRRFGLRVGFLSLIAALVRPK